MQRGRQRGCHEGGGEEGRGGTRASGSYMATCQLADHHYHIRTLNMPSHVDCLGGTISYTLPWNKIFLLLMTEIKNGSKQMVIKTNFGNCDAIIHSCCFLSLL